MDNKALANQVLADIKNKNKSDAMHKLTTLLDKKADLGNLWGGLTRITLSVGEIDLALACANLYLAVAPDEANRRLQVASIYAETGKISQAITLFTANNTSDDSISGHHFLGTTYSQIGEIDLAISHLKTVLQKNPLLGISWLTLASLIRFTRDDEYLATLSAIENKMRIGNDQQNQIPYWFAFGKALLDIGEEEAAFAKFSIGCQLMSAKFAFNDMAYQNTIRQIISHQNHDYFSKLPTLKPVSQEKHIFIIGLPRSGTTLLQQILTSHSEVSCGGESNNLALAIAQVGDNKLNSFVASDDPDNINKAQLLLQKVQKEYSHLVMQRYGNGRVLDKSLNINHYVGILQHLYPNAAFINITRDITTTAWSCFRTFFSQGLSWSFDIKHIATFFKGEQQLIQHWQSLFGDKIYQISYEDLVAKPEVTIEKCCQHLGLNFEQGMLNFSQSAHPVQTASVGQVRKQLNNESLSCSEFISNKFKL